MTIKINPKLKPIKSMKHPCATMGIKILQAASYDHFAGTRNEAPSPSCAILVISAVMHISASAGSMGGARKFQLGGSRGAEGRARGQAYGAGASRFFLFGGGRARILTSAECTPKWNLHLTLPASEKKFAVSCKGSATFVHF